MENLDLFQMKKEVSYNLDLDPKEVEECFNLPRTKHGVFWREIAEEVNKKLKKQELIKELKVFLGNCCIMGLMQSQKKEKVNYWAFLQFHPFLGPFDECYDLLGEEYPDAFKESFDGHDCPDLKELTKVSKLLSKKNRRDIRKKIIITFLKNLKSFPNYNRYSCSREAYDFFNKLFSNIVKSEKDHYLCPFDGETIKTPEKGYLDLFFCSKTCKNSYFLLLNDSINQHYEVSYQFQKQLFVTWISRPIEDSGVILPKFPEICLYCANKEVDFTDLHNQVYFQAEFYKHQFGGGWIPYGLWVIRDLANAIAKSISRVDTKGIRENLTRLTKINLDYYLCKNCAELVDIEIFPKFFHYKITSDDPRVKEYLGKDAADLIKEIDNEYFGWNTFLWKKDLEKLSGSAISKKYPLRQMLADNHYTLRMRSWLKLIIWEFIKINAPNIIFDNVISFLVAFNSIDKKNPIDWLEMAYFKGWAHQLLEMYGEVSKSSIIKIV